MYKNALLILSIVVLAVSSGCNKKELEELRNENKELNKIIEKKNKTVQQLESQYNKIEQNLQLIIAEKEDEQTELKKIANNKIMKKLENVRETMRMNKDKAKSSEGRLDNARYQANKYKKEAQKLEIQLEKNKDSVKTIKENLLAKNEHIEELNSEKENQDSLISKLKEQNSSYKDSLNDKIKELNRAFIAAKPKKQLKKEDIIEKKGGFLGFIGQVKVLNPAFNEANFETLNVKEKSSISIDAKPSNVELITPHPESSYTLEKEENKTVLNIENKDNFWRAGKHLVITY